MHSSIPDDPTSPAWPASRPVFPPRTRCKPCRFNSTAMPVTTSVFGSSMRYSPSSRSASGPPGPRCARSAGSTAIPRLAGTASSITPPAADPDRQAARAGRDRHLDCAQLAVSPRRTGDGHRNHVRRAWAINAGLRFRAVMTSWRNVRFDFQGNLRGPRIPAPALHRDGVVRLLAPVASPGRPLPRQRPPLQRRPIRRQTQAGPAVCRLRPQRPAVRRDHGSEPVHRGRLCRPRRHRVFAGSAGARLAERQHSPPWPAAPARAH